MITDKRIFETIRSYIDEKPPMSVLIIGLGSGNTMMDFLSVFPNALVTGIDTWDHILNGYIMEGFFDGEAFKPVNTPQQDHDIFIQKAQCVQDQLYILKTTSYAGIGRLINEGAKFDYILHDGSILPKIAIADLVMSFPLLKENGILHCKNYHSNSFLNITPVSEHPIAQPKPKLVIDTFYGIYHSQLSLLPISPNDAVFMKIKN